MSLQVEEEKGEEDYDGDVLFAPPNRSSTGTPLPSIPRDELSLPLKSQSPSPYIGSSPSEAERRKSKGDAAVRPRKASTTPSSSTPTGEEGSSSSGYIAGSLPGLATEAAVGPVKQQQQQQQQTPPPSSSSSSWDKGVVIRPPPSASSAPGASSPSSMPWTTGWTGLGAPGASTTNTTTTSATTEGEVEYPLPMISWLSRIPTPLLMQPGASTW